MSEKMNFPIGWDSASLGEVLEVIRGISFSSDAKRKSYTKGLVVCLRTSNIQKEVEWDDLWFVDEKYVRRNEQYVQEYDILISTANSYELLGKVALVKNIPFKSTLGTFIVNIRVPKQLSSKFIYYFLASKGFQQKVQEQASTTTNISNISTGKLKELDIPLPPLPEQYRIVEKIEALFSELDNGVAQLKTAQQQLKVYRQAVLKWAFEGNGRILTNYLLRDVSLKIQIGPFGLQLHKEDYVEGGIPIVNPMHIHEGKIIADDSYTITKTKRNSLSNYILQLGDIVMGRRGEMGRCGLVGEKEKGWLCGTGSLYVRPNSEIILSDFLYYYLISITVKKFLERNAAGTTMANLNSKIVNNIPLSIPSLEEQHQIVQEIETRLSVCDKLEETITASLQQAEALRQSILKKAFEGQLVPQNPNDEPASVLLERIREEKLKQEVKKVKGNNIIK